MTNRPVTALKVVFLRRNIDEPFTYSVPEDDDYLGYPVVVPLGNQLTVGLVIEEMNLASEELEGLKEIRQKISGFKPLPPDLVKLGCWVADYYISPVNRVFEAIMPPRYLPSPRKAWQVNPAGQPELELSSQLADFINNTSEFGIKKLQDQLGEKKSEAVKIAAELVKKKILIEKIDFVRPSVSVRKLNYVEMVCDDAAQLAALKGREKDIVKILDGAGCFQRDLPGRLNDTVLLRKLEKKKIIKKSKKKVRRVPLPGGSSKDDIPEQLTPEQHNVLETIRNEAKEGFKSYLLHGVTGSGKTEIYFRLVRETLERGQTALVLVPEITLAAFLLERFRNRFGEELAILHSELSAGERSDEWRRVQSGEARVVLGVQSAVFAPLDNLGLIVVDEEHDSSYKSGQTPRYHSRDVAVSRASLADIPVVLGSATPSLESVANTIRGKYKKLEMFNRPAGGELPTVLIEDLRASGGLLTETLIDKTARALDKNHKAIWFLNRRGYSNFLLCGECGATVKCNNCNISMTPHSKPSRLRCHYCGYSRPIPKNCPDCDSQSLETLGAGTQRLSHRAEKLFPDYKIIRMDADTVAGKGKRAELLTEFAKSGPGLLLGTQMVTKGLDFESVDFVGVINADTGLQFPDFRSGERTFQQLVQVCGRAGRGHSGSTVLVQTYNPKHYSIQLGVRADYKNFYCRELEVRKPLKYPPFARLINFIARGHNENEVASTLNKLRDSLPQGDVELLGPVPCGIDYLKGRHRWHLLARGRFDKKWRQAACRAMADNSGSARVVVDVDPVDVV